MRDDGEGLAQGFDAHRAHLQAVAVRLLGSPTEADDAVQETWLRVSRAGADGVENLGGWLTTVVSRVCLNMLEARRSRREDSLDLHAPEPVARGTGGSDPEPDPAHDALLTDAVGPALLVVLDTLEPAERLAFVLHDVFGVPFDEIATIVGRSPVAARQLASRAPPRAGHGDGGGYRRRSCAPARRRGGVPGRRAPWRFRRVAGPARSRGRAPA